MLDRVPLTMPKRRHVRGRLSPSQRLRRLTEDVLVGAGLSEAYTWSLAASDPSPDAIRLPDPMTADQAVLRTTLLPGLVGAVRTGLDAGADSTGLFEIARVYLPSGEQLPEERWRLGGDRRRRLRGGEGRSRDALRRAEARASCRALDPPHAAPGQEREDRRRDPGRAPSDAARGNLGRLRARSRNALLGGAGADGLRGRHHVSGGEPGHRGRRGRGRRGRAHWSRRRGRPPGRCSARRACSTSIAAIRSANAASRLRSISRSSPPSERSRTRRRQIFVDGSSTRWRRVRRRASRVGNPIVRVPRREIR